MSTSRYSYPMSYYWVLKLYSCFRHRKELFLYDRAISYQDYLRVRIRTTEVTEKLFEATKSIYQVVDVDGARTGRRKWLYTWDGAAYLFFVASLAGYNRSIIEDQAAVSRVPMVEFG